jgi:hypothetical protein
VSDISAMEVLEHPTQWDGRNYNQAILSELSQIKLHVADEKKSNVSRIASKSHRNCV